MLCFIFSVEAKLLIKLLFTVDSDEDDEPGPSTPVNIVLPKRKDEEKKAEILAAKKEFTKKLAEIKFMMEQNSDSSDDDLVLFAGASAFVRICQFAYLSIARTKSPLFLFRKW